MNYSIYIITAFLISATSLFSIVELEEVLQIYPDGGTLYGSSYSKNKVFHNGDTILVRSNLTASNNSYNLKLSTDRGITWQDITESFQSKVTESFNNLLYSELGSYYLKVNSKDTLIEYYNLDGELIRTASPPNKSLRHVSIMLNPLDENFVGSFYNYTEYLHRYHYHHFYTSIDRGEKWHFVSPEGCGGGSLTIDYIFSSGDKSKIFFDYDWSNVYVYSGGATFSYDTYTNNIDYISAHNSGVYCYECTGENEYVYRKSGESEYKIINVTDKTERPYELFKNTLGFDMDSISQYDDTNKPSKFYERISPSNRATNLENPNHQIIELTHFKFDSDLYPERYIFVHQYYF